MHFKPQVSCSSFLEL